MTGTNPYQVESVNTAGPAQLVLMLFDGSLAAISRAAAALAAPGPTSIDIAHRELTRAQDIVLELQLSLDHEAGGQIARSLDGLYSFCLERLVAANVAKDPQPLATVSHVLNELRESWNQAVATLPAGSIS